MASVGELFIQLGVLGNANELKKANAEFQRANILAEKQAKLEKLKAEYREKLNKAETKAQKMEVAKQYKAKKALIEKKAELDLQNLEQKKLRANIAEWATYAHAVTMACNVAINAIKKINDEVQKATSYGQNMINLGMTTSTPLAYLQKYGRVANALNSNISEQQVAQRMAQFNQALDTAKSGNWNEILGLIDQNKASTLGSKANALIGKIFSNQVGDATTYFEEIRNLISGETPERKVNLLKAFGLDENYLPMLNMGRGEFENYASELMKNAQTEEQLRELADIKARLNIVKQHFDDLVIRIFGELAPTFESIYKAIDENLPHILSFIDLFIEWFKETFTAEKIQKIVDFAKDLYTVLRSLWNAISPIVELALKGWGYIIRFLAKKLNEKEAQDKVDEEARNKRFYDPKTNRYYGGVAGSSWAVKLDDSRNTLLTRLMDFLNAPETAYTKEILDKRKAFIDNYSQFGDKNKLTGDINTDYKYLIQKVEIQTPQMNSANDFMTSLQNLQTGTN